MNRMNGKALIAEFIGTFALVFIGVGAIAADELTDGGVRLTGIALAHGMTIAVMVSATAAIIKMNSELPRRDQVLYFCDCGAFFLPLPPLGDGHLGRTAAAEPGHRTVGGLMMFNRQRIFLYPHLKPTNLAAEPI